MQRKKSPHGKDFSNETSSEAYEKTVNFEVFHCIPLLFDPRL
jgi:hypothetical protein